MSVLSITKESLRTNSYLFQNNKGKADNRASTNPYLFQNNKGKADNRARILAWLAQLDNQVKMADEKNILPSEVVNAGVGQLSEWAKDSPAVDEANAHHAYNKVMDVSKAVSEGLSKAERDQVRR